MALIGLSACGEDQDPWCDQLEEWSGLDTLSQAIESGDATTAAEELVTMRTRTARYARDAAA